MVVGSVDLAPQLGRVGRQRHRLSGEHLRYRGSPPIRVGRQLVDRFPNDGSHR